MRGKIIFSKIGFSGHFIFHVPSQFQSINERIEKDDMNSCAVFSLWVRNNNNNSFDIKFLNVLKKIIGNLKMTILCLQLFSMTSNKSSRVNYMLILKRPTLGAKTNFVTPLTIISIGSN